MGKYIGIKLIETAHYTQNNGYWFYLSKIGACGSLRANMQGDALANANLSLNSNYDVNINATDISSANFT